MITRENIRTHRSGDNLIAVDLIYSPDDGGYYLEKFLWIGDKPGLLYHSPIYKDKASLKIAYTSNSFKWDELT
jgi:hypothetical protein